MDSGRILFKDTGFKDPQKFAQVCELLHTQKLMLAMIQPNRRSFSNPNLRDDIDIDHLKTFRRILITQNFNNETINDIEKNKCDNKLKCDNSPEKPTPIPRKNGKKQNSRKNSSSTVSSSAEYECFFNTKDSLSISDQNYISNTNCSASSEIILPVKMPPKPMPIFENIIQPISLPTKMHKNSFRSFLKMNKFKTNKFLSLRTKSANKKSLFDINNLVINGNQKPKRPTRIPPPPPVLVFRPPAPLPKTVIEKDFSSLDENKSNFNIDTISELYHDNMNNSENEGFYYTVDDDNNVKNESLTLVEKSSDQSHDQPLMEDIASSDNYYDDGLCIYESLSSNDGTIYEEYCENELIYDNAELFETNNQEDDKKCLKQLKKLEKMMKKFQLSPNQIPINAGIVKKTCRGSKNNLMVQQGETVLILRMENNPPGKWLAKNERSKIGYIDLNNVFLETDSIKATFQSFGC